MEKSFNKQPQPCCRLSITNVFPACNGDPGALAVAEGHANQSELLSLRCIPYSPSFHNTASSLITLKMHKQNDGSERVAVVLFNRYKASDGAI